MKHRKRLRVMGNGELYSLQKVFKLVKMFQNMTWIEQESLLSAIKKYMKKPPNQCWTSKTSLREIKNKNFY